MSAVETPVDLACPRCGAAVRPDQDWCLMCGAAVTTKVAGAPGWRTPVAIAGVVLAIAAAALVFAFLEISNDADRAAQAPTPTPAAPAQVTTTPTPVPTPAGSTPTASPTPGTTPSPSPAPGSSPTPSPSPGASPTTGSTATSWPAGKRGWTVVFASTTTRSDAQRRADAFKAKGQNVGVLNSDEYSSLRSGFWVVFSGVYDTQEDAQKAAEGAQSAAPGAYAREVVPR